MKKFYTFILLCVVAQLMWASPTVVTTDEEIRAAVLTDGANIQLGADINLSNTTTLSIDKNLTVTIDLNGHKLDRKLTKRGEGGGQVITVRQGATLHLSNGTLAGGWGGNSGGIANESGTVTLTDVVITGCVGDDSGGGICNLGGTLTMTGGALTNNRSNDHGDPTGGGGIFNAKGATATLKGVTITGNSVVAKGGGGICNYGEMTLDGCTVTGNSCRMSGGGIYTAVGATLNIQGALNISGNTTASDETNNLFLKENQVLTVTGSLEGSSIGINMEGVTGVFTSGYKTHNSNLDPATIFAPDAGSVMAISLDGDEAKLDNAVPGSVYYIERSWDDVNKKVVSTTKTLAEGEYTVLTGGGNMSLNSGYYVVKDKISRGEIDMTGGHTVHLILCDGARLSAKFIHMENDEPDGRDSLFIYSQSSGGNMGRMRIDDSESLENAGIGTDYTAKKSEPSAGTLLIHGGDIYVQGGTNTAAIGGGRGGKGGHVYIYGGKVEAHGGNGSGANSGGGAGIGGGYLAPGGSTWVYGGEVYAYGGQDAAGIGSGDGGNVMAHSDQDFIHGGWFTMYGGYVETHGGGNGAGIGGGEYSPGPKEVNIYGGVVKAYGGEDAAGIGCGYFTIDIGSPTGVVNIYGGEVYAKGGDEGAGIGGGENSPGATVTIMGGIVVAEAGENELYYKAIGPGRDCDDYGKLTLGDNMMVSSERKAAASERRDMCWYRTQVRVEPCDHSDGFTYTVDGITATDHHISHCPYCLHTDTAEHTFDGHGVCTVCGVQSEVKTVVLWMPKAQNDDTYDDKTYAPVSTHSVVPNTNYVLQMATINVPGYRFIGWEATTAPSGSSYESPYTTDTTTLYQAGSRYLVTENIGFVARYKEEEVVPTGIYEWTNDEGREDRTLKYLQNGILFIERDGKTYNANGQKLNIK